MSYNTALETKVIRQFVNVSKQERYIGFIKKIRTRAKFINELHHMNFLQHNLFDQVVGGEHALILQRLRNFPDVNTCYVISENSSIDGKTLSIEESLNKVIGADIGSLLVFGDATIVYAEAEGFNLRWLSKLPSTGTAQLNL